MNDATKGLLDMSKKHLISDEDGTVDGTVNFGEYDPNVAPRTVPNDPAHEKIVPDVRYRDNALDGFRNGACLDLRVRLAMDLLTHSPMYSEVLVLRDLNKPTLETSEICARHALDVATELFALAEKRGLVEPFTEFDKDEHLKAHIRRQVFYQLEQTKESQKQQDQSVKVTQMVKGAFTN